MYMDIWPLYKHVLLFQIHVYVQKNTYLHIIYAYLYHVPGIPLGFGWGMKW